MKTNPNDFAHSAGHKDPNSEAWIICGGLSKREYFAAMAMQGLLAANDEDPSARWVAKNAREYADALIAELNKES